jgi:hypothetical protein
MKTARVLCAFVFATACTFAQSVSLTGDAYISSSFPTSNFGNAQTMFVGSSGMATAMMQFDLTNLPAGTTSGNISKAVLVVFAKAVSAAGNVGVAPITSPFVENAVTFNTVSGIGAPFVTIPLAAAQVGTFIAVDVTTQVQTALAGGTAGFAIVPQDATVVAQFEAKESTATSHQPSLQVFLASGATLMSVNVLPGTANGSLQVGRDTGSNPGSQLLLASGSPASGSMDLAGGDLILAAGQGTGLGGGGNVRIQTAGANDLSGTADDLLVDREIFVGRAKQLTLAAPGFTSLMSIHLVGTHTAGGRIFYNVRATDGGSQIATETGLIQYTATANSITCTVQTDDKLHLGTVNSGCTPGFFNPGSQPGISIFDNVSFSSPAAIVVHEVYFRITNESGASIRLEP